MRIQTYLKCSIWKRSTFQCVLVPEDKSVDCTGTKWRPPATVVCLHLSCHSGTHNWTLYIPMFRNANVPATSINPKQTKSASCSGFYTGTIESNHPVTICISITSWNALNCGESLPRRTASMVGQCQIVFLIIQRRLVASSSTFKVCLFAIIYKL